MFHKHPINLDTPIFQGISFAGGKADIFFEPKRPKIVLNHPQYKLFVKDRRREQGKSQ